MTFGVFEILSLIGALGFFIFGMKIMSDGIQKFAGDEIEKAKNYVSIVLSYLGVPQEIIALIRGI